MSADSRRRRRRGPAWLRAARLRAVVAAAAAVAVLAATGGCGGVAPAAPTATAAPTRLTIATSFAIHDLDPLENGFWAPEFGYGALLLKPLKGGRLAPWLLAAPPEQTSATVWTLRLRPGLTFHNGAPLDAAALAGLLTFHLAQNPSPRALLPGATAAATGPLTVTLTTGRPISYVPSLLGHESMFPIFDLAAYRQVQRRTPAARPAALVAARIWSGPYVVTALTPESMSLAPAPGYRLSTPRLTALTVRFIPDAQARILAVQHGEADLALYPPTSAARELAGRTDAYFLNQAPGTGAEGFQLVLNPRTGPLSEVAVRRALSYGIDYAQLATQVLNGQYDTAVGWYPGFLPYARRHQTTDPARAGTVLAAAGWSRGPQGLRSKAGKPLRITMLTYPQQPDARTLAVAVQAQLRAIGFDVQVRQVDDITAAVSQAGGWDAAVLGNGTLDWTQTDPVTPIINSFTAHGDHNYGGIRDPRLERLAADLTGTTDPATRERLLARVQEIIVAEQAYGVCLARKRVPVVASPALRGYQVPPVALLWVDAF